MSTKQPSLRDEIAEIDEIRSKLRIRWNTSLGCHEVYTTIRGSGIFKWFRVSEQTANWYRSNFNLPMDKPNEIDRISGAFKEYNENF